MPLWLFDCPVMSCLFSRSRTQVEPLNQFSRFMAQTTCFHTRKCLLEDYSHRWCYQICYVGAEPHADDDKKLKIETVKYGMCLLSKSVISGILAMDWDWKTANIHCVSKKLPTFKLSVTLSNLNLFSKFLHCWKAYEICYKTYTTPTTSP